MNVNDLINSINLNTTQGTQQSTTNNEAVNFYDNNYFKLPLQSNYQAQPNKVSSLNKDDKKSTNQCVNKSTTLHKNTEQRQQLKEVPITRGNIQTSKNISGSLRQSYISPNVNNYHRTTTAQSSILLNENNDFEKTPATHFADNNLESNVNSLNFNPTNSNYNNFQDNIQNNCADLNQNSNSTNPLNQLFGGIDLSTLSNLLGGNFNLGNLCGNNQNSNNNGNMINMLSKILPLLSKNNHSNLTSNENQKSNNNQPNTLSNLFSNFINKSNMQNNNQPDKTDSKNATHTSTVKSFLNDEEVPAEDFDFNSVIKIDDT